MTYVQDEIALGYYSGQYCGLDVIFSPDGEYINATKLAKSYKQGEIDKGLKPKRKDIGEYLTTEKTQALIQAVTISLYNPGHKRPKLYDGG